MSTIQVQYFCLDNFIDGQAFIELTTDELKELIPQIGLKKKFIHAYLQLVSNSLLVFSLYISCIIPLDVQLSLL